MTSHKLSLDIDDRDSAHTVAGALDNLIEPAPEALSIFERDDRTGWLIEAYYSTPPEPTDLAVTLAAVTGLDIPPFTLSSVPDLNWVALSQAALPPVRAGRFTIHGSHDRSRIAQGPHAIQIDAGEAFGTAHHATTFGCLAALDAITRNRRFHNVLDLGTGSGVLAIAVLRLMPHARILASDLDATSVSVARANCRSNRAAARIRALCAVGLDHSHIRSAGRFDLLIANILAGPLHVLAPQLRRAVAAQGVLILSGILNMQAPALIARYTSLGFRLARHDRLAGWSTLTLQRASDNLAHHHPYREL
jgi:ribosomal protein L11 methyltransferase